MPDSAWESPSDLQSQIRPHRLSDPKWTEEELIGFMLEHPILINRPIVVTPKGARLCRPSETVLDILPNPDIGEFTKEDGEVVVGRAAQPQS